MIRNTALKNKEMRKAGLYLQEFRKQGKIGKEGDKKVIVQTLHTRKQGGKKVTVQTMHTRKQGGKKVTVQTWHTRKQGGKEIRP